MEYHPSSSTSPTIASSSFAGKTLVLPAVSHGNVGQLASDLIVNTSNALSRLGCLDHPALLPCVGCGAFSSASAASGSGGGGGASGAAASAAQAGHQLALGMEVYGVVGEAGDDGHLVVVQQRAEVVIGAQRDFADATAEWIASAGFSEVVIMASIPSFILLIVS